MKNQIKILLSTFLLLSGCSNSNQGFNLKKISKYASNIFSTRPISSDRSIVVMKLNSPALFEKIQIEDGQKKLDPELDAQITNEQNEAITKIKAIAPDVQILFQYKLVLNALVLLGKDTDLKKVSDTQSQFNYFKPKQFSRPSTLQQSAKNLMLGNLAEHNSVKFIGDDYALAQNIKGQNIQVGIIDTGIDYTHAMMMGPGSDEIYKSIDTSKPTSYFPNAKVIGGIDLVGKTYDAASENFDQHIPVPDENPIDEGGHGSHVAGTVAGIGDGINTYNGVAPEAKLHAIKVFGANGSTSDEVVIAGLEYAARNNLDVVNLSLGSEYGEPHILYAQAIKNLTNAGTVVVASAGNSGQEDFIVGAPSVATDAISVAASIDDADQNWKFKASELITSDEKSTLVEAIEGQFTKPIDETSGEKIELIYVGLADKDFDDATKNNLKNKVALIDRGVVPFAQKISRAQEAGALGVVMINNQTGDAIPMGGDTPAKIPAIMIRKDIGDQIKIELNNAPVFVRFKTDKMLEKKEIIDTITNFSSKGPRPIDGFLKPEISAPGENIISAGMGSGTKGIALSGTSMAGPHIAGVMALLKQAYPTLTVQELKSLVMGTTKTMHDRSGKIYPLSVQGTGRVQVDKALQAKVIADYSSLSLGILNIESKKSVLKKVLFKNLKSEDQDIDLLWLGHNAISFTNQKVHLKANEEKIIPIVLNIDVSQVSPNPNELDGYIFIKQNNEEIFRLPVLAVIRKISRVDAGNLIVHSSSAADQVDALSELTLTNNSKNSGNALLFNLISTDDRKQDPKNDPFKSHDCDLQAAGYRMLNNNLQIAIKLFSPMTNWQMCDISVQIDSDKNNEADQELVGIAGELLPGLNSRDFKSVLLDAIEAVSIRKKFESDFAAGKALQVNYENAILDSSDFTKFDLGNVAIVQTPIGLLKKSSDGSLNIKIATTHETQDDVEPDDYLERKKTSWFKIDLSPKGPAFLDLPAEVKLESNQSTTIQFTKGAGQEKLLVLFPQNQTQMDALAKDNGLKILKAKYSK